MMVAMFECRKCMTRFEAEVEAARTDLAGILNSELSQIRKCPTCGRAGTAGVWQSYAPGTLRVIKEIGLKVK